MSPVELLWTAVIGTAMVVIFAAAFIAVVIGNQRKLIRTQREKLAESLRLQGVLRQIPKQIMDAQEEEQGRVAKELHDGINQMLASIKYRLHTFKAQQVLDPGAVSEWMDYVSHDLESTMDEVKRISHNLRPKIFDDLGFLAAARSLCEEFLDRNHCTVQCELSAIPQHLPRETELGIYRILQEALHNIEKHARPASVSVTTIKNGSTWRLHIKDNGRGFNPRAIKTPEQGNHSGFGMTTMKQRATLMGGTLEVNSTPEAGTEIILTMPSPEPDQLRK